MYKFEIQIQLIMLVSEKLQVFYIKNNLSVNGGEQDDCFTLAFRLFSIKLPNANFRKRVIHIHDMQHILYDKDITWKGEAFIAGWEIATNIWKHLPLGFLSLWAMGFSLLTHPKDVLKGYKKGLLVNSLIDLNLPKETLYNFTIEALQEKIRKENPKPFNWFSYSFWVITSLIILISPIVLLIPLFLLL